ncbi:hypothetical protein J6590_061271 [Homalodisca vitripennis]|nr:hypothetical protein J6590_061271 [Homalodisca vitripennis]
MFGIYRYCSALPPLFLSACHDHPIENKREELVPPLSTMLTVQQKAQCVIWYAESKSIVSVQRLFRRTYPGQTAPDNKAIVRWFNQFRETGTVGKKSRPGRPRTSEENVERIRQSCGECICAWSVGLPCGLHTKPPTGHGGPRPEPCLVRVSYVPSRIKLLASVFTLLMKDRTYMSGDCIPCVLTLQHQLHNGVCRNIANCGGERKLPLLIN